MELLQELFNHSAIMTLRYIAINQDIMEKAIDDLACKLLLYFKWRNVNGTGYDI